MYIVYILKSEKLTRYYIGHTASLSERIKRHNSGQVKSTKPYRLWTVIYTEEYKTKSEAFRREMQIKSFNSGNSFKQLINNMDSK